MLLISLVAALLSVIYSCAVAWLPFKLLNFIITIVMAKCLQRFHIHVVKAGRIRNSAVNLIVGIILFLVFVYWHFIGYAAIHSDGFLHDGSLFKNVWVYLSSPDQLVQDVLTFNRTGVWAIFGMTSRGVTLAVIWIIEHIIIFRGVLSAFRTTNNSIYLESKKCWAEKKTLDDVIQWLPESVEEHFELGNFCEIEESYLTGKDFNHCEISYFTDKEEQSGEYYLEVTNVTEQGNTNPLVMGLEITKEDLNHIRMLIHRLHNRRDEVLNELLNDLPEGMLNKLINDLPDDLLEEGYNNLPEDRRKELREEQRYKLLKYLADGMPNDLEDDLLNQLINYLRMVRLDGMLNDLRKNLPEGMLDNLQDKLLDDLLDETYDDLPKNWMDGLLEDLRYELLDYLPDDLPDNLQDKLLYKLLDQLLEDPPKRQRGKMAW